MDNLLTIQEISRRSGVAASALRFYEAEGVCDVDGDPLSLVSVGQEFFWYQWDALLLETAFTALMPPMANHGTDTCAAAYLIGSRPIAGRPSLVGVALSRTCAGQNG